MVPNLRNYCNMEETTFTSNLAKIFVPESWKQTLKIKPKKNKNHSNYLDKINLLVKTMQFCNCLNDIPVQISNITINNMENIPNVSTVSTKSIRNYLIKNTIHSIFPLISIAQCIHASVNNSNGIDLNADFINTMGWLSFIALGICSVFAHLLRRNASELAV